MTASRTLEGDARPAEVLAWAMFDFANSGYTTVVITAVFNAYFVAVIAGNAPWATFAWTAALSVSYALILLTGPVLGAVAMVWLDELIWRQFPLLNLLILGLATIILVLFLPRGIVGTLLRKKPQWRRYIP